MRIGVFVCHCGLNIARVVDIQKVIESAKDFRNVVDAEDNVYLCSAQALECIKDSVKKHNLDRVVVAACTPHTHEHLFRSVCQEAGLNPYLFEFVNIREQCSWVHTSEPEEATRKAIELIKMGVAKAAFLEPLEEKIVEVERSAMVIGAGIAGMTAALSLSRRGFKVYLIEMEPEVGGMLKNLNLLFPTHQDSSQLLKQYKDEVNKEENIRLLTSSTVKEVEGYIGNFDVTIVRQGEEVKFKVGTIIVATGAVEFEPKGLYGYGEYDGVMTQLQFERALKSKKIESTGDIVMIQDVGSKEVGYCGRIGCIVSLKNAMLIKEKHSNANVYILFTEMQAHGPTYEDYYMKAKEKGIRFVRFDPEKPPKVLEKNEKLKVKVYDKVLEEEIEIPCDLVVLSTPLVQREDAPNLSRILRIPLGMDDFFLEAHKKLRPAEFITDGIYLCGTAHAPKDIQESVVSALAAAEKAAIPMTRGKIRTEAATARINEKNCCGCRVCEALCPFDALTFDEEKRVMTINDVLCRGCGVCVAACYPGALNQKYFGDEQIMAMILSLGS